MSVHSVVSANRIAKLATVAAGRTVSRTTVADEGSVTS
jgi:hypothetical protein